MTNKLPTRILGKTAHHATLFSLGGEGVLRTFGQEAAARKVIERALDLGVNYFDSAPAYAGCLDYLGANLGERRKDIFLASKTAERSRAGSLRVLDDTLRRLRTDHLDLWQLHDIRTRAEVREIFSDRGAIHALLEARADGRVRHLGLTGHHDPAVLLDAMSCFDFDTVLIPLNCADVHRMSFLRDVVPVARAKGTAVIAMKTYSGGLLALPGLPLAAGEALRYALSLDGVSCAIVGCRTPEEVEQNAGAVRQFVPLEAARRAEIENIFSDPRWTPYK
ncbi:MAG TPA: aldo/keto reductase [Bryobacteraceae bacterium]|nr:aldo/keto reductase [Bryobacteraceae bacterium]